MKISVFGAGATGGFFAVQLMKSGHDVSVVARGTHLEAIRRNGLTLEARGERQTVQIRGEADASALGVQDVVIVGVKGPGIGAIAESLRPLVGPETLVIFPQNGISWWYPVGLSEKLEPPELPDFAHCERFLDYIRPERLVGGSIYSANELAAPGVVRNTSPKFNRLDIGSVVQGESSDIADLRIAFRAAGIECPNVDDIRRVIWRKLLANMSGSVIALITGNRSSISRRDPDLGAVYRRVMAEGQAIAAAYGYDFRDEVDVDDMLAKTQDHKPSLLQDYEAGRQMEIAQIVLAPRAFARKASVQTPAFDTLAAIASRLAADRGLHSPEI